MSSAEAGAPAIRRFPRPGWTALATVIYVVLAIQLTWPLAKDPTHTTISGYGDLTGSIATFREYVDEGINPFSPGTVPELEAPYGSEVQWAQNVAAFESTSVLYVLTFLFGALPAFALFGIGGFVATGAVTFALVRKLTGNPWIALLIGWAYAFYPFAVSQAEAGHLQYVHGWPFVLILWRMLVVYEAPTVRNGLVAGAAAVAAFAWTPYYMLVGGIEWAALVAAGLVVPLIRRRRREFSVHLKAHAASALLVLGFVAGLFAIQALSASSVGVAEHDLNELINNSARPKEYVVPHEGHVVVGEAAGEWRRDHLHESNLWETNLYVGWTLILLSIVAVAAAFARRLGRTQSRAVLAAAVTAVVALVWSAPPEVSVFGNVYPFPSRLTFEIAPEFRVYSRFVWAVMLAVCVLAAIGIHRLLRTRSRALGFVAAVTIAVLVVLDLRAPAPAMNTIADQASPSLERLAELPAGAVAHYPIGPSDNAVLPAALIQDFYDKPILNGYGANSLQERRALQVADLEAPDTAGRLAMLGVRWALLDHTMFGHAVPDLRALRRRYGFIMDDGRYALYEVVAPPKPLVSLGAGFGDLEEESPLAAALGHTRTFRWLKEPEGTIELLGPCDPCRGTLSFDAESLALARRVELVDEDGSVIGSATIPPGDPKRISFPVEFRRRAHFKLRATPGPLSAAEATGFADTRELAVSLTDQRLRLR